MNEYPAVYTLTANPIRVEDRLDYLRVFHGNENTMDGELE